jgi:L-iditol 2-dehydrogenase
MTMMRAAVLVDVDRIELRHVPIPNLREDEVLVRVQAVGLCGTDLHIFAGHANYNRDARGRVVPLKESPQILGHEITGVIEELGGAVHDMRPGDRVVLDQGRSCMGERRTPLCEYCATGDSHQCAYYREHGITDLPGGLAEFIAVPALNAVRLATDLAPASAALTEPLGCVVHSIELLKRTPARYGLSRSGPGQRMRTMLVCGAGPSGLLFIQYVRNVIGFDGTLLVSEPNVRRRLLAEGFGAETIDPSAADIADVVRERTQGNMVELLIEASGSGPVFTRIPELIRKQATLLLYGHGHVGVDLSALNGVQFMEPTMISPAGASGGFEADGRPSAYVRALKLVEEGRIEVDPLITHRYDSLAGVPGAFGGDHRQPDYVKGVVVLA